MLGEKTPGAILMRSLSIILLFIFIPPAFADDFSWPRASGGGISAGTSGQDEYYTEGGYPGQVHNPDANERKRLVVQWGKVSMGYIDVRGSFDHDDGKRWIWKDDNSLAPDRRLAIRGRLLIESADGKDRRPIDWMQGVRVIVSRLPDKKYDWSRRQEMHEAEWGDFVIQEKGEFLAYVSPGEVRRTVGKETRFQVALSLGEKQGAQITWRNTTAVLPQSVTMLTIPGPPPINQTMRIINGAPSYSQNDFNPAKLVRAVNHLTPMGKEKAIPELRAFLKIARDSTNETVRCDEDIDTSDRTCVFLIVRLLFEPAEPGGELPDIATVPFVPVVDEKNKDKKLWPLYPVYLQDDVPFFLVYGGALGGMPDQPDRHVDWAEKHGKIRGTLLRPIDNPMLAAARLAALPQTQRLYKGSNEYYKQIPYRQAWEIIEDADPKLPKPRPIRPANSWEEPRWDDRAKAAAKIDIHWSKAEQRYVVK
jgi:hypothetical protein